MIGELTALTQLFVVVFTLTTSELIFLHVSRYLIDNALFGSIPTQIGRLTALTNLFDVDVDVSALDLTFLAP
jgi:hypothetical protein